MYSFPKITLPPAAIEAAHAKGKSPDVLYCLELLEETGLSCVPGSGFQQIPGTFHIRTTILVSFPLSCTVVSFQFTLFSTQPPEDCFDDIIQRFSSFHKNFLRYAF